MSFLKADIFLLNTAVESCIFETRIVDSPINLSIYFAHLVWVDSSSSEICLLSFLVDKKFQSNVLRFESFQQHNHFTSFISTYLFGQQFPASTAKFQRSDSSSNLISLFDKNMLNTINIRKGFKLTVMRLRCCGDLLESLCFKSTLIQDSVS